MFNSVIWYKCLSHYIALASSFILTEEPPANLIIEVNGNGFELLGEQFSLNRSEVKVDLNIAQKINKDNYGLSTKRLESEILSTLDKNLRLNKIITDYL